MTFWRAEGTLLPDGHDGSWWVTEGRLTDSPVPGAELLPGRFLLPGLVDAHCHLTLSAGDAGPIPSTSTDVDRRLQDLPRRGVLALRDTGAHDDTAVSLSLDPDGDVEVIACGRFLAAPGRYFPGLYTAVDGPMLAEAAVAQIRSGASWVKLIADFPENAELHRPSSPSFGRGDIERMISAVHAAGGRVAAHVTLPIVRELVDLGVDSIEHGTGLDEETLSIMAARGVAWTPTLMAVTQPVPLGAPPEWKQRRADRLDLMRRLLPVAQRLGVPVLTGSDVVGDVAGEVSLLVELGFDPTDALRAATTRAREYLGLPGLAAGAPADLVTYTADPRNDPEVLAQPAAVLRRGVRVR